MHEAVEGWMHRREMEAMVQYAMELVDRFDAAIREGHRRDAAILAVGIVAVATKLSRLVWPYGQRATDRFGVDAAGRIRSRLGWDLLEPIAPASLVPLQAVFRMDAEDAWRTVDTERRVMRLPNGETKLDPLISTIRAIGRVLAALPERPQENAPK